LGGIGGVRLMAEKGDLAEIFSAFAFDRADRVNAS
jgi:hypothetical protein